MPNEKNKPLTRGAPAFQMYAPDRLTNRVFRAMSAAERGLFHTIELECWVNGNVPADIRDMSRTLGMDQSEVKEAFTDRVRSFLGICPDQEGVYVCADLEDYRSKMIARREKMVSGGKNGAEARWARSRGSIVKNKMANGEASGAANEVPNGSLSGAEASGEERKGVVFKKEDIHDDFIQGLEGDPDFMRDPGPTSKH